jgi:hypothetical protein
MTPDERNMLQDLADKVAQTPAPPKDAEAEDFIRKSIGSRPDALYLMTQTVLIQNLALQRAQQQIQELQQRASQPVPAPGGSSFLGGQAARPASYSQPAGQQYSAPPPTPPQYAPPAQTVANPGGGSSSFLRGAAQTAAGVAGGVLAADAIASMFGHGGGFGGFGGSGFMGGAPVEEVVNNYYEAPPQNDTGDYGNYNDVNASDQGQDDQGQYDDGGQIEDAGYDSGDDGGGFDDSGDNFA